MGEGGAGGGGEGEGGGGLGEGGGGLGDGGGGLGDGGGGEGDGKGEDGEGESGGASPGQLQSSQYQPRPASSSQVSFGTFGAGELLPFSYLPFSQTSSQV